MEQDLTQWGHLPVALLPTDVTISGPRDVTISGLRDAIIGGPR